VVFLKKALCVLWAKWYLISMKTVVLLIGSNDSGKTETLKTFFRANPSDILKPMQVLKRKLNRKDVLGIGVSSPQELCSFCDSDEVKRNIEERIGICEQETKGKDYFLVIPFEVYRNANGEINSKCIIEPLFSLRVKGKVVSVYLRKGNAEINQSLDLLMNSLSVKNRIGSTMNYEKQAKELEEILRNEIDEQRKN
jgi:hypothetical protein